MQVGVFGMTRHEAVNNNDMILSGPILWVKPQLPKMLLPKECTLDCLTTLYTASTNCCLTVCRFSFQPVHVSLGLYLICFLGVWWQLFSWHLGHFWIWESGKELIWTALHKHCQWADALLLQPVCLLLGKRRVPCWGNFSRSPRWWIQCWVIHAIPSHWWLIY